MSERRRCLVAAVCVVSSVWANSLDAARAQSPALAKITPQRELSIAAKPGELDILRKVPTASTFAAVVSDVAGALIVAHAPQPTVTKALPADFAIADGPDLTVYRLDAQGEVGAASPIRLPRAAKLASRRQYPLAVAVHPKLPLLYVWQDVVAPAEGGPADDQATDGFRHLHIYEIASAEPRLIQSAASGESFSRGSMAAGLAVDRTGSRLFVPNMQRRIKTGPQSMIGYLKLGPDGKVVDDTPAGYAAAAKTSLFSETPCGLGYHDVTDSVTIVCAGLGPATWDERNRRAQLNVMTFFPAVGAGYRYRMAVHPSLPVVYLTGQTSSMIYRVEHVDGYFTMFPQRAVLPSVLITSPPVVVGKRALVACSSVGFVHLLELDAEGYLSGKRSDVALTSRKVEGLAYSAKFDRLYATFDEVKK